LNRPFTIIAGQFPPPVNGFAYITQEITNALSGSHETTVIDIAPHYPKNGAPYHLRRLSLTLKGFWPVLRGCLHTKRRFYVACEGGLGLVYTLMLCAVARILGFSLYIHHHSFSYIEDFSLLMASLLCVMGKRATHIFLCPLMAQRFADRYQRRVKTIVLSNSAFVDAEHAAPRSWQVGQPLVIGLLSNLNDEKGLGAFLDILHSSASETLNIKGVLAGPPVSDEARNKIANAKFKLGDRLDYRGPVYGKDKSVFFQSIDLFIYATKKDAQPMVIFEAMAHGVPILSFDRGCIKGQVDTCGAVFGRDDDFIPFALDWIKKHMNSPHILNELQHVTKSTFIEDRAQARQTLEMLFELDPHIVQPSRD